jgi:hypothetical protein
VRDASVVVHHAILKELMPELVAGPVLPQDSAVVCVGEERHQ